jgi:hypothetical protein
VLKSYLLLLSPSRLTGSTFARGVAHGFKVRYYVKISITSINIHDERVV